MRSLLSKPRSLNTYVPLFTLVTVVLLTNAPDLCGQQPQASRVSGEVTAINTSSNQLTLKPDKGEPVMVTLGERTRYLRVKPGETDLKNASKIAVGDLAAGDRVLALGKLSEDAKALTATSIIVMTKADIAQKQELDRAAWQTRGITGTVTGISPDSKEFTVVTRTAQGERPMIVESAEKADFRRYAPDSVRFTDAKPSSFGEIKVGDHVRVLGEKNSDNTRIKPEAVVSGSFRNLAATVIAVDPASNEIRVTDLSTKKAVVVRVNQDTVMKRLPQMMAAALARHYNPQFVRNAGGGARGGGPGGGGGARGGPGGEGGMRFSGSQGGDLQQMLEKVPAMPIGELNKGDAILISSTAGADAARVTAISLVAGVEPMLTRAPSGERQMNLDWSLDMGLPQ
jgi:hypothetical protein